MTENHVEYTEDDLRERIEALEKELAEANKKIGEQIREMAAMGEFEDSQRRKIERLSGKTGCCLQCEQYAKKAEGAYEKGRTEGRAEGFAEGRERAIACVGFCDCEITLDQDGVEHILEESQNRIRALRPETTMPDRTHGGKEE